LKRRAKQRNEQHLLDEEGQKLFRTALPKEWVLREYRPDYGLDFSVELFKSTQELVVGRNFETLGEHIFVQLKSTRVLRRSKLKLYGRKNVEKQAELIDKSDYIGEMQVVQFSLETSELVTIQRMGAALPVLLVVADVLSGDCYFICLNDYIDKVLIPRHADYASASKRVVHIPLANKVADPTVGHTAFRWYGKRAKLYAAFQKFIFQSAELGYARQTPEFVRFAKHFALTIARFDFWHETEMWEIIGYYGRRLDLFLKTGSPQMMVRNEEAISRIRQEMASDRDRDLFENELNLDEIYQLWRGLAVLPRNYEDICREWFLPTPLSFLSAYPLSDPGEEASPTL